MPSAFVVLGLIPVLCLLRYISLDLITPINDNSKEKPMDKPIPVRIRVLISAMIETIWSLGAGYYVSGCLLA